MIQITGYPGVFEVSRPARAGTRSGGRQTIRHFRGPIKSIEAMIPELDREAESWRIETTEGSSLASVFATFGGLEDGAEDEVAVTAVWSVQGNLQEKEIFEHPKALALESALPGLLAFLKRAAENFAANPDFTKKQTIALPSLNPQQYAHASQLYFDLIRGVRAYPTGQYVVRRVRTVKRGSKERGGFTNFNKQISTADLIKSQSIPAQIADEMPKGFWLRMPTTVNQLSNGQFQISEEWWYSDFYSQFIYDSAPITP